MIFQEPTLWCTNGLLVAALAFATITARPKPPQRLAIYYGFPSLVNGGRGDLGKAAQVFSKYDVVVLATVLSLATLIRVASLPGPVPTSIERRVTSFLSFAGPGIPPPSTDTWRWETP